VPIIPGTAPPPKGGSSASLPSGRIPDTSSGFTMSGSSGGAPFNAWATPPNWADSPISWDSSNFGWHVSAAGVYFVTFNASCSDDNAGGYPYGLSFGFKSTNGTDPYIAFHGSLPWFQSALSTSTANIEGLWKPTGADTIYIETAGNGGTGTAHIHPCTFAIVLVGTS
jgi:hypothetical protein